MTVPEAPIEDEFNYEHSEEAWQPPEEDGEGMKKEKPVLFLDEFDEDTNSLAVIFSQKLAVP